LAKYSRQGVQTNLNLSEVSNLQIPVLDLEIQNKVSKKVQESCDLKEKSKRLLEIAKTIVEMAIETDEEKAINWSELELQKLNICIN
jgi:restriction endonuclease S subunit